MTTHTGHRHTKADERKTTAQIRDDHAQLLEATVSAHHPLTDDQASLIRWVGGMLACEEVDEFAAIFTDGSET